jgi:hypothetical protein
MSALGGKADISDGRSKTVYLPEIWNIEIPVFVVGLLNGSWHEAQTHPLPPMFFEATQGATMNQTKMSQIYQG